MTPSPHVEERVTIHVAIRDGANVSQCLLMYSTCDNTRGMSHAGKLVSIVLLSVFALGLATLAEYLFSILWIGEWAYLELIAPICASVVAATLALGIVASINRRHRGIAAVVRLAALLSLGCFTSAAGLFFVVLANCSLSCGNKIVAESRSPNGRWKAVSFSRNCYATARYCPPVTHVSVLPVTEELPGGDGNVFSIDAVDGIDLAWKSDDVLLVRYFSGPVLRKQKQIGDVRVEYMPVGHM